MKLTTSAGIIFLDTYLILLACLPSHMVTPPKINIEPENDGLEDVSPFPGVYCQVPC